MTARFATGLVLSSLYIGSGFASTLEVACFWNHSTLQVIDPAAKEAAKFHLGPTELAYFRLNTTDMKVENADQNKVQEIYFPALTLSTYPNRFTLTAYQPNISGLKGRRAQIHIDIDRFTLRSVMILEMSDQGSGRGFAHWRREGQCFKKAL